MGLDTVVLTFSRSKGSSVGARTRIRSVVGFCVFTSMILLMRMSRNDSRSCIKGT